MRFHPENIAVAFLVFGVGGVSLLVGFVMGFLTAVRLVDFLKGRRNRE